MVQTRAPSWAGEGLDLHTGLLIDRLALLLLSGLIDRRPPAARAERQGPPFSQADRQGEDHRMAAYADSLVSLHSWFSSHGDLFRIYQT